MKPFKRRLNQPGFRLLHSGDFTALTIETKDKLLLPEHTARPQVADVAHHETPAKSVDHKVAQTHCPATQIVVSQAAGEEHVAREGRDVLTKELATTEIVAEESFQLGHGSVAVANWVKADMLISKHLRLVRLSVEFIVSLTRVKLDEDVRLDDSSTRGTWPEENLLLTRLVAALHCDGALRTNLHLPALLVKECCQLRRGYHHVLWSPS